MLKMTNQELGSSFEIITKDFFVWLLESIGFTITKARVQKAGSQNGFDILIIISKDYIENKIFIECKNYESDISIGNILKKGLNLESNYTLDENDLFIAINPRSSFSNEDNSEKLSPILSDKFKFSYYALDITNGVKELFALNNQFFKLIYQKEVDFEINEEKEINRFKNIIFSRKPFKKIIIKDSDKIKFIGHINLEENHIERYFSEEVDNKNSFLRNEKKENLTLSKILEKEDKIFIIGNPGIGKSTELKKFALQNWITDETENFVPIFKSLKNFTNTDSITDYLPTGWKELNKVFFILDGIDEISDIKYFKSKLENFINQNIDNQKKYKYIISCRTNVYESIVKGISNFKVYYLKDLNYYESLDLLKTKCGDIVDTLDFHTRLTNFLKTPFQLEILANFINDKKEIPKNTTILWETYINNRFSHDKDEKLKKISLNVPALKKWSKKISLINELMKSNIIDENNLYTSINEDTKEFEGFKKNPLINKLVNQEEYFFEHRNIQEYFAALALSNLSFSTIKEFILIEKGINKTHPSLFNTITFLINIIDSNKYDELVQWLIDNESELLFKADSNRIESFRVSVFQHYFQSECIEKKFWISSNRTFSVKEIAEFGNCETNFDYLVYFINEIKSHFRVIISALDLLSHFTIPANKKEKLKDDFFILLQNSQNSEMVKSHILDCICDQKLCEDNEYLNKIFELFKNETSKEINIALLSLIEDYENIDDFFWYIKLEFLRDRRIVERAVKDEVMRGTSLKLEKIIIKLKTPANFVDLVKYYFDETQNNYSDDRFTDEIIQRCLYFENLDEDFLVTLLSSFDEETKYYLKEDALKKLILKSRKSSQIKAFECLIAKYTHNNVGYFLASITKEQTIDIVIDNFVNGSIESANLDFYRNVIASHGNRALAEHFNNVMLEKGFEFVEPFLYPKEFEILKTKFKKKPQENFDLLFDKPKLLSKIETIFQEYGTPINSNKIQEIDKEWYKKNGHSYKIDSSNVLLRKIVNKKRVDLEFKNIEDILEDEIIIINEIKLQIQTLNNSNNNFTISKKQEAFIYSWYSKASNEIRFDKVIGYITINNFNILEDYNKLKTVLFFLNKFNFDQSQEFLLNSIEFFDVNNSSEENNNLELLKAKINNNLFNKRIIENLNYKKLFYFILDKHIQYALDNNLSKIFPKIREYFLMEEYGGNIYKKLEQYISLTNDIELLKELCIEIKSHNCWTSLKLLMNSKIEKNFCEEKAVQYLNLNIDDEKNYYYSSALAILFELNSSQALKYVFSFLDLDKSPSLNQSSYTNYDIIEDYSFLNNLFNKIYAGDRDSIGFSGLGDFMTTYVSNLSKKKESYILTQTELKNIKNRFEKLNNDNELFYVNQLIDNSKKSYINSQSKALNFNEALLKVEEIIK
jgi:hypothetical protein